MVFPLGMKLVLFGLLIRSTGSLPTVLYGICAVITLLYKPNQK